MHFSSDIYTKPMTDEQREAIKQAREIPMKHYDALTQGTGYRINPEMADAGVIIRRARKQHRCNGGHDGNQRTHCAAPIEKGTLYIEYVGESPLYQAGQRYHFECATQQGLLLKAAAQQDSANEGE